MVSQERLKELLTYSVITGEFRSLANRHKWRGGAVVGCRRKDGYILIRIDDVLYLAHVLAHLYLTGDYVKGIDHANRNPSNNAWINLRVADQSDNLCNTVTRKDNTSGHKGVSWIEAYQVWDAAVQYKGVRSRRKFKLLSDAIEFVRQARGDMHGDFARHA